MTDSIENTLDAFCTYWQTLPREDGVGVPRLDAFLDGIKPAWQPHMVLVDINSRDQWSFRQFGTGRHNSFDQDVAKIDPLDIYNPDVRPYVLETVQTILSHPCGWRATHRLRSAKGVDNLQTGVTLPLKTDDGAQGCVVNFVLSNEPLTHDDRQGRIEEIMTWVWMDLGAGVPKPQP